MLKGAEQYFLCWCFPQVPDYYDVIKHPMDLSTMRKKVEENVYSTLNDFEKDFYLVWHNATIYNHKDTIYYRAAIRVKEAGVCVYVRVCVCVCACLCVCLYMCPCTWLQAWKPFWVKWLLPYTYIVNLKFVCVFLLMSFYAPSSHHTHITHKNAPYTYTPAIHQATRS